MRRGRLAAILAIACLAAFPAAEAGAIGETYDVVFCSSQNPEFGGQIETTNAFSARSFCDDDANANAVKIDSFTRATEGRKARAIWKVEDPLGITGVSVEGRLRRADGYLSELFAADARGQDERRIALGGTGQDEFRRFTWEGEPQAQFIAELRCAQAPSCLASEQAHTWVRDLRFTVADYADPEVRVEGKLVQGGWLRASQAVRLTTSDQGAGLSASSVTVNGVSINDPTMPCGGALRAGVASTFEPCDHGSTISLAPDTAVEPFVNGLNQVQSCATDFAGNSNCLSHQVSVDNEAPALGFSAQNPDDPELIRVPVRDEFSGLATGAIFYRLQGTTDWRPLFTQKVGSELQARVDSAAELPGTYEFMATATDVAGNTAETLLREDGTPMTLDFPLRSGVELKARIEPGGSKRATIRYGKRARVEGQLLDAAGQPLADKPVVVDESFGEGALIDHRVRTVITDEAGRWIHKMPPGPSRSVSATYEGDQRYLDEDVQAGRLAVRTGANLRLTRKRVPEGRATTFKGRVGRLGARIPPGGKLVQIQFQDPGSGRWSTVRNPFRTKSDGRYRFQYGFGTHYVSDVAIRFRLKVPGEQGWPYRGAQTGARRVIVEARE